MLAAHPTHHPHTPLPRTHTGSTPPHPPHAPTAAATTQQLMETGGDDETIAEDPNLLQANAAAAAAAAGATAGGYTDGDDGDSQSPHSTRQHTQQQAGGSGSHELSTLFARKEEVQRLLAQVLVIKDPDAFEGQSGTTPGTAPVITNAFEEANLYSVITRHFKEELLLGSDKFYRAARAALGVQTWRPRVQGTQLKALTAARLPQGQAELRSIELVVNRLADCLLPTSSPAAVLADLAATINRVTAWWEARNITKVARGGGGGGGGGGMLAACGATLPLKRRAGSAAGGGASKRQALDLDAQTDQWGLSGADAVAAVQARMLATGAAGAYAGYTPSIVQIGGVPYLTNGFGQPGGMQMGAFGNQAAAVAAAAAAGGSSAGGPGSAGCQPTAQQAHAAAVAAAAAARGGGAGQALRAQLAHTAAGAAVVGGGGGGANAAAAAAAGSADTALADPRAPINILINDPKGPITLNVGGRRFTTTINTLLVVPGCLFVQLFAGAGPPGVAQRLPESGELFIDRCGEQFHYVLEFLRACANNDPTCPLPEDARALQELAREAHFYSLPELLHLIQVTPMMPAPSTRSDYDVIFLETGFKNMDTAPHDMERSKDIMIQQLNLLVRNRAIDGFAVDSIEPGVDRRQADDGSWEHNLSNTVLLKRTVPILPVEMVPPQEDDEDEEGEEEEEDGGGGGQQQQQQNGGGGGSGGDEEDDEEDDDEEEGGRGRGATSDA